MELVTQTLDVKINGKPQELKMLDYGTVETLLERLSNVGDTANQGSIVLKIKGDTILAAGMPEDALKKLQMDHINQIFDALVGTKKD